MTFEKLFWMHAGALALLIVLCTAICRRRGRNRFSTALALAYLVFILLAASIYFTGSRNAQEELYWLIPAALTLPSSLLLFILKPSGAVGMAVLLVLLGTAQFWWIGSLVDWLMQKKRGTEPPPTKSNG